MVKIDYSTVSTIFRGEEASCSDELINNFARTLYEFFKQYSFGEIYVLQNCTNVIIDLKLKRNAQGVLVNKLSIALEISMHLVFTSKD